PAHAKVQREPRSYRPVILEIEGVSPPSRQPVRQGDIEVRARDGSEQKGSEIVAAGRPEGDVSPTEPVHGGRQRRGYRISTGPNQFVAGFEVVPSPDNRHIIL